MAYTVSQISCGTIFYWSKNKNLMPREGTKNKKLEWEKYKFDAPEGTWKKNKFLKADCTPGPFQGSVNLHKLA